MSLIIGLDSGGTYTDAVLYDDETSMIWETAKELTTHDDLAEGIKLCLTKLINNRENLVIDRIMISTTLATNAVVEGNGQKVGVLYIGKESKGPLPSKSTALIDGKINIKGHEEAPVNFDMLESAVEKMKGQVDAFVISGFMSIKNPIHEIQVKNRVLELTDIPVLCCHELINNIGFHDRTVTAVLNARLMPIINNFLYSIDKVLKELNIQTKVYIVRGDGSIVKASTIKTRPVETILSGPAASIVGARFLSGLDDAFILDMGGTTTDTAKMVNREVKVNKNGADISGWKTMIRSLDIKTFGIGGDSKISIDDENMITIGPKRCSPSCKGGDDLTPTDIVHFNNEFEFGDKSASLEKISEIASKHSMNSLELVLLLRDKITEIIYHKCIAPYLERNMPVVAIGAPAGYWIKKTNSRHPFSLIIPDKYEVANAVGAAVAEVTEREDGVIRMGDNNIGFYLYLRDERIFFTKKQDAISYAKESLCNTIRENIKKNDAIVTSIKIEDEDVYVKGVNGEDIYIETSIHAEATGTLKQFSERKRYYD